LSRQRDLRDRFRLRASGRRRSPAGAVRRRAFV